MTQNKTMPDNATENPPISSTAKRSLPPNASSYTADNIIVLEGLEGIRKRPSMYIGSAGKRGFHHLVFEVLDNSIDENMEGFADKITVVLNIDGSCSIHHNGRGIPVAIHKKKKSIIFRSYFLFDPFWR